MAHLPTSRIKTIMKSTSDVETVNKEAVYTLTRATVSFSFVLTFYESNVCLQELFIKMLTTEAYKDSTDKKKIDYKNLANVAHKNDHLEFLREIVPKKITVKQYREMMARKQQNGSEKTSKSGSSSSNSDSDSSSSSAASDSE